jgi:hypothetical protein
MTYYVYAHYKLGELNIPFYIGKGNKRRAWRTHNRNKHWKNTVNKYGYEVRLLAEHLSEADAFWLEKQLIGMFGRADLDKGPLVNYTDGGEGASGHHKSEKSKQKMRNIMMGNVYAEGNTNWSGKTHSEESKQKNREANSGNKHPMFGKHPSEVSRCKMSEAKRNSKNVWLGKTHTNTTKNKISSAITLWWKRRKMVQLGLDISDSLLYTSV